MNSKLISGHFPDGMNFKRPCWLALFASLGMMLTGYGAYYGMFPYGRAEEGSTWKMLAENGAFLLMVVGASGFVASLTWWFMAAIKVGLRGSRRQSVVPVSTLTAG